MLDERPAMSRTPAGMIRQLAQYNLDALQPAAALLRVRARWIVAFPRTLSFIILQRTTPECWAKSLSSNALPRSQVLTNGLKRLTQGCAALTNAWPFLTLSRTKTDGPRCQSHMVAQGAPAQRTARRCRGWRLPPPTRALATLPRLLLPADDCCFSGSELVRNGSGCFED